MTINTMAVQIRDVQDHSLTHLRYIALDGIPASGKTSTMRELTLLAGNRFTEISEPVRQWQNLKLAGHTIDLLREFYNDPNQLNSNFLQYYISLTLYDQAQEIDSLLGSNEHARVVTDRSVKSNRPFIEALRQSQVLNKTHADIQTAVAEIIQASANYKPTTIYFQVPPEVALQRIERRSRPGENNIELEYLQLLFDNTKRIITEGDFVLRFEPGETAEDVARVIFNKCF